MTIDMKIDMMKDLVKKLNKKKIALTEALESVSFEDMGDEVMLAEGSDEDLFGEYDGDEEE